MIFSCIIVMGEFTLSHSPNFYDIMYLMYVMSHGAILTSHAVKLQAAANDATDCGDNDITISFFSDSFPSYRRHTVTTQIIN